MSAGGENLSYSRRAFTMIELIFVIVILGILAAVVMPRLMATRDDAEVAKACANLTQALSDIGSYRVSQASFSTIDHMTDIRDFANPSVNFEDANVTTNFKVGFNECVEFKSSGDGNVTVRFISSTDDLCQRVKSMCGKIVEKTHKFGGRGVKL